MVLIVPPPRTVTVGHKGGHVTHETVGCRHRERGNDRPVRPWSSEFGPHKLLENWDCSQPARREPYEQPVRDKPDVRRLGRRGPRNGNAVGRAGAELCLARTFTAVGGSRWGVDVVGRHLLAPKDLARHYRLDSTAGGVEQGRLPTGAFHHQVSAVQEDLEAGVQGLGAEPHS